MKQLIANLRNKVYVSLTEPATLTDERKEKLICLTNELSRLGYILSPEAILYLSEEDITEVMDKVVPYLNEKYYPGKKWKPLYPGFPQQVISKTEKELWEDQHKLYETLDYSEFIKNNPWYTSEEIEQIESRSKHSEGRVLGTMTETDLLGIFRSILMSGNSLASTTRDELMWFLKNYPNFELPEKIPFKETLCIVMSYRSDCVTNDINDILRYGIYSMGGSADLRKVERCIRPNPWNKYIDNPEWRNLKATRKTRVEILQKIDNVVVSRGLGVCIPDAKRFYGPWVLLSERVHPGEYSKRFPNAAQFFQTLKSKESIKNYRTWNSLLQEKYNSKENILEIAKFVAKRPGEFIRRFDSIFRKALEIGQEADILDLLISVDGMKNKTLLELRNYYEKRVDNCPRLIYRKGLCAYRLKDLEPLSGEVINTINFVIERRILGNIKNSVKEKDLENKTVFIDPEIKDIPVPVAMRDKIFVIPPSTRFDIPEDKKIIRMFIHWIQKNGVPEDLDLHAYLYRDDTCHRNIGWHTGTKLGDIAIHSGDVLNRDGDCAEYVDIDIDAAKADGWNYVVMDVMNYKGRNLSTLDNWLGYTTLENMENPSKTWVPKNIEFSQKISVEDTGIAAWIFDLNQRQAILVGAGLSGIPINSERQNQDIIKFFAVEPKFSCYDVLLQWYKSRGASIIEDETKEYDESIKKSDIVNDYTKILEILG